MALMQSASPREKKTRSRSGGGPTASTQQPERQTLSALLYHIPTREVAEFCGVSDDTASRWRTGSTLPFARNIPAIAKLLKVDPSAISQVVLDEKRALGFLPGHRRAPDARQTGGTK